MRIYGERIKGKCPTEAAEQITFFNELRRDYPDIGAIAVHIRNEGEQRDTVRKKAEGMVVGAADIIIPGSPAFVCELKRRNYSHKLQKEQLHYLEMAEKNGAFACVALGYEAALEALKDWLNASK